jgi:hypothetical protein
MNIVVVWNCEFHDVKGISIDIPDVWLVYPILIIERWFVGRLHCLIRVQLGPTWLLLLGSLQDNTLHLFVSEVEGCLSALTTIESMCEGVAFTGDATESAFRSMIS